ncbi:MAG: hypothetical protein H7832_10480 [Magnetococcus sp. DMHC-6]
MTTDFCDAAKRHMEDADFLFDNSRLANADHLYGFAAECALKAVINESGTTPEWIHINKLWDQFITFANGRKESHYATTLGEENSFKDWKIEQRYHIRSSIHPEIVIKHQQAAKKTMQILDTMIFNQGIQ